MLKPFFSIITATFNSEDVIEGCLKSVFNQNFTDHEHLILDGKSSDKTIELIDAFLAKQPEYASRVKIVSEPDLGIYDAFNKGLDLARGQFILYLGSDDRLFDEDVLSKVFVQLNAESQLKIAYGTVVFTAFGSSKIDREWLADTYMPGSVAWGWMPPFSGTFLHLPTLKQQKMRFDIQYRIAADLKLVGQLFGIVKSDQVSVLDFKVVRMLSGGVSGNSLWSTKQKLAEDYRVYRELGLNQMQALIAVLVKRFRKIKQLRLF